MQAGVGRCRSEAAETRIDAARHEIAGTDISFGGFIVDKQQKSPCVAE
jgi:hypothetical protein